VGAPKKEKKKGKPRGAGKSESVAEEEGSPKKWLSIEKQKKGSGTIEGPWLFGGSNPRTWRLPIAKQRVKNNYLDGGT